MVVRVLRNCQSPQHKRAEIPCNLYRNADPATTPARNAERLLRRRLNGQGKGQGTCPCPLPEFVRSTARPVSCLSKPASRALLVSGAAACNHHASGCDTSAGPCPPAA